MPQRTPYPGLTCQRNIQGCVEGTVTNSATSSLIRNVTVKSYRGWSYSMMRSISRIQYVSITIKPEAYVLVVCL